MKRTSPLPNAPNADPRFVLRVLEKLHRACGPVHPWRPENPVTCLIGIILAQATNDVLAELSSIEGIGIKTATITLMFGCNADLCAVDTHLERILQRLRIVPPKASPDRACRILRPLIPKGRAIELHLQLIRFGRTVCKAQRPQCSRCALRAFCPSRME